MRILFVHNHLASFVRLDLEILQSAFQVTEFFVKSNFPNLRDAWQMVNQHDLVFGWFASWHTFYPLMISRKLKKPSILVIGGYDLANLPEISYGSQRGGIRKLVSLSTIRYASKLIANSCFSQKEAQINAQIPPERIQVIHHGLPDPFGAIPVKLQQPVVLTVGNVEKDNLYRKGLLPFATCANEFPDLPFKIVGKIKNGTGELLRTCASNLELTGWVSEAVLHEHYQQASVYVQASLHEAFSLSMAEAMLAGCIPVASPYGALPEVVGDAGILLKSTDPQEIAGGIRQALQCTNQDRQRARERILTGFPLEKRRQALINLCLNSL